jgi:small subunit ribosomal protein S17
MKGRGVRKKLTEIVVGDKMDKTIMVLVSRLKKERTYGKYVRSQNKFMVHDPMNSCQVGDKVKIVETRPLSKRKRWQVLEKIDGNAGTS